MVAAGVNTNTASGRRDVRPLAAAVAAIALLGAAPAGGTAQGDARISVTEAGGVYSVAASFTVPAPAHVVLAALTDYGRIPEFMPAVRVSTVRERGEHVVVEQEAVARYLMFSRRVHLVLEVEERADGLSFRDRCGRSFARYEGSWTVSTRGPLAEVGYALTAKPSFAVPGFLLKRLLERDAGEMIERLAREIASRARM